MGLTNNKIEAALEMALAALSGVAATGSNEEKIAAAKALIDAVEMAGTQLRKEAVAQRVLPLLSVVTKNLAGQMNPDDPFAPALSLDIAQQGSLLMSLSKEIG